MILALALVSTLQYGFAPGLAKTYTMKAEFTGFLPILGGNEGKVVVDIGFRLQGNSTKEGNLSATSDINRFKIVFNEATLPLTTENVKEFFPKTTIVVSPQGKLISTDAPNVSLPVRLPGLDVKRFPDISYLSIEFPAKELGEGDTWTFSKPFGDTDVVFDCRLTGLTESEAKIDLKLSQEYEILEDVDKQVVKEEKDAFARVKTTMKGAGKAVFDRKLGLISIFEAKADAVSDVTEIKSGKVSKRSLVNKLDVRLDGVKKIETSSRPRREPGLMGALASYWDRAVETGTAFWNAAEGYWMMIKLGIASLPSMLPGSPLADVLGRLQGLLGIGR
ncbi:MAG: hypothetical protein HONBIEJF_00753 [Fimbriimonadaceae bacterium]|nr:hypothetical protein [Fimbriimonadaceae bacterium]